jgi:uncharacterized protein YceK
MRRTWVGWALVAIVAVSLTGCGTVANLGSGKSEIYGGVAKDIEFAATPRDSGRGKGVVLILPFWLAELSCSAVADTLTIPIILSREAKKTRADEALPAYPPQYAAGAIVPQGPCEIAPPFSPKLAAETRLRELLEEWDLVPDVSPPPEPVSDGGDS